MVASVKDVATLAGVSPSTVSNYLHRPHLLASERRERVAAAIEQLGYVPNESARQLRNGASRTIALILLDAWIPFYAELARGVEDEVRSSGMSLFFANSGRDAHRELENIAMFDAHRVQGIIINPQADVSDRLLHLRTRRIQSVLMSPPARSEAIPSVGADDFRGGQLAGEHLLGLGRRRITFIGNIASITHSAERFAGLQAAAVGSDAQITLVTVPTLDTASGIRAAEEILELRAAQRPDAVFAANDMLALGAMSVLVRAGVRLPEDVAMVGYDDVEAATLPIVPLTSVRQPAYDMGRKAASLLLAHLEDPTLPAEHVLFDIQLIARESTLGKGHS